MALWDILRTGSFSKLPSETSQQQCKANEVFTDCGSACEPSCKNPKPEICTEQCVVGCQCKPGFFRNDQGACVAKCSG
ncbi:trypsin Inhibitor like cysteine rich domain protein [Ancylostoma duodenale]|uniref:Trypsin Inhibitor like cysteine rich domain protein n=1 Tax=Ancylostoma duodenale TaxID=51022 RepID=A0A0C2C0E7_9BILA|nr:trypsin Inhibitor like cysteine rich domain protein [Ancylostoma duodenale]